ncbi:MAG: EscU/YscU/HrcU family type III secretion system export apparatus switch protein [Alphaproteobacteria bacterium]|nr:EscU/YscU/HrcU family type III secretion system export apparatus switch protein [Alphaproteobacteria bacterium]
MPNEKTPLDSPRDSPPDLSPDLPPRPKSPTAVAVHFNPDKDEAPRIIAAGRGKIAEEILKLAFENDVRVREDGALAEMLAKIELESPVPSEAFMAVAEILSYVYRANNEPNPFDALINPVSEGD